MKHQYESEILFHLMERDGFNIPSSVPPYESEIKAYLINQVKLAYPKLTDYEAEWLLYNYTKHLPADFPISSATNVTKATFENVVPFAYQSAILKGQTLVNLVKQNEAKDRYIKREAISNGFRYVQLYNASSMSATRIEWDKQTGANLFKTSTKYYIQFDIKVNKPRTIRACSSNVTGTKFTYELKENESKRIRGTFVSATEFEYIYLYVIPLESLNMEDYTDDTFEIVNLIIAEYQDGMENWDISYFEGMQSVKMPGLTVTGKNLFDGELEIGGLSNVNGLPVDNQPDRCRSINYIKVNSSTDYVISLSHSGIVGIREFDEDYKLVSWASLAKGNTFTTSNQTKYLKIIVINTNVDNLVQLEEGTTATPYEPYKSNILTTPSDLELRGIGDAQDTLDCLTGEVTQRIVEVVLDGNSTFSSVTTQQNGIRVQYNNANKKSGTNIPVISNKFNFVSFSNTNMPFTMFCGNNSDIYFMLPLNSNVTSMADAKNWFNENNTIIQFPLATASIKTVDLKTINESGESVHFMPLEGTMHVQSSGEPVQPTFDMSVPVEATTQNLASFINLEMEE